MQRWLAGKTAMMWNAMDPITDNDRRRQKEATAYWARRRADLPGPISFMLPDDTTLGKEKARVLGASESVCACGMRRRYVPLKPCSFYAVAKPEIITLGPNEPPLAITIWGGSLRESVVDLSVVDGALLSRSAPYDDPKEVRITLERLGLKIINGPVPVGFSFNTQSPDSPNPFRLEACAVRSIDTRHQTVDLVISRNCKRAGSNDPESVHPCT